MSEIDLIFERKILSLTKRIKKAESLIDINLDKGSEGLVSLTYWNWVRLVFMNLRDEKTGLNFILKLK